MAHPHIIPQTPEQYRRDVVDVWLAHAPRAMECPVCPTCKDEEE